MAEISGISFRIATNADMPQLLKLYGELQSGVTRPEAHKFYESMGFDGNSKRAFEIRF